MSDLQKFFILLLIVVATAVFGRLAWEMILPPISTLIGYVPSLLASVPGWLWWVVFGVAMSMVCPLKIALLGGRCRTSSRCSRGRRFGSA